jgi:hypothetical protein
MTWKEYQTEIAAREREEETARALSLAQHQENIAALRAKHAALKAKIAAAERQAERQEAVARELRQAQHEENIRQLKARYAELEQKIGGLDWLCYLPGSAESPGVIQRAETYLEKMRSRLQAEGTRMWLCYNHDCVTRIFEISEFREIHGSVFCRGNWTALGEKYRHLYRGVSVDNATFAGDVDLITSIHTPANCLQLSDMPAVVQIAARSPQVRGLAGAACLEPMHPARGVTGIYRLAHDKQRIVGGRSPASCPYPEGYVDKNLGTL